MIKVEPVTGIDTNERLAYSVDQAAAITGLSRDLLYDQMRTGKLAYLRSADAASSHASISKPSLPAPPDRPPAGTGGQHTAAKGTR